MFQHRVRTRRSGTGGGGITRRLPGPVVAAAGGIALAVAVAACAAPGGGAAANAVPTAVSTKVAGSPVTVSFFVDAGLQGYEEALAKAFHAQHPSISFTYNVEPDNDYNTVANRVIASGSPPDIVAVPDLITAVKDGLLTNLDAYAAAYGWTSKVPASVLVQPLTDSWGVPGLAFRHLR
jgi:raffinose/stachyose/melibiose transport system substrate-binding protein